MTSPFASARRVDRHELRRSTRRGRWRVCHAGKITSPVSRAQRRLCRESRPRIASTAAIASRRAYVLAPGRRAPGELMRRRSTSARRFAVARRRRTRARAPAHAHPARRRSRSRRAGGRTHPTAQARDDRRRHRASGERSATSRSPTTAPGRATRYQQRRVDDTLFSRISRPAPSRRSRARRARSSPTTRSGSRTSSPSRSSRQPDRAGDETPQPAGPARLELRNLATGASDRRGTTSRHSHSLKARTR